MCHLQKCITYRRQTSIKVSFVLYHVLQMNHLEHFDLIKLLCVGVLAFILDICMCVPVIQEMFPGATRFISLWRSFVSQQRLSSS